MLLSHKNLSFFDGIHERTLALRASVLTAAHRRDRDTYGLLILDGTLFVNVNPDGNAHDLIFMVIPVCLRYDFYGLTHGNARVPDIAATASRVKHTRENIALICTCARSLNVMLRCVAFNSTSMHQIQCGVINAVAFFRDYY